MKNVINSLIYRRM